MFIYPDDQLIRLVLADALYEVTRNHDAIVAANSQGSVNAATYKGTLYGYPMTADNGYFLFYDKSVLTEEDVKTLDGILAAAEKAGKQFNFDVANGWYLASFFLGNGCVITLDEDGCVLSIGFPQNRKNFSLFSDQEFRFFGSGHGRQRESTGNFASCVGTEPLPV